MNKRIGDLWILDQAIALSGPVNMALDEILLNQITEPLLRFYPWSGDWVSFGYFKPIVEVRDLFIKEKVSFVRRRSGGGVVDHRIDQTYSILAPKNHPLCLERGAGSYAFLHGVLAEALRETGLDAHREDLLKDNGDSRCFENPVQFDLIDSRGNKISGAGQHRGRSGLIHQGSIQNCELKEGWKDRFADGLADRVKHYELDETLIKDAERLAERRYGNSAWLERR